MSRRGALLSIIAVVATWLLAAPAIATAGTWDYYESFEGQVTFGAVYETAVQPPINANGTSNFRDNGRAVIPVKFGLSATSSAAELSSVADAGMPYGLTYSGLYFMPDALTLGEITNLRADLEFLEGDCYGGSPRFSLFSWDGSAWKWLYVYLGVPASFTGCVDGGGQTVTGPTTGIGVDLTDLTDSRVDIGGLVGGYVLTTWQQAAASYGSLPIHYVYFDVDAGWAIDQRLRASAVTVNDSSFSLGEGGTTCDLPPATISIEKTSGASTGVVNEPVSIQPSDQDGSFRVVDCKYMYNLATSSLSGAGHYKVWAVIDGTPVEPAAEFDLI